MLQEDESDFILQLEGVDNPKVKEFKINNDQIWNEICSYNQCTIEYTHTFLDPPSPETNDYNVGYGIDFNLMDPITNKDLTLIQKKFVESFGVGIVCSVKNVEDILESNDTQKVKYNCSDDNT